MDTFIYKKKSVFRYVYSSINAYYFFLALLMVTPYYYILNPLSVIVSFFCLLNYFSLPNKYRSTFVFFYLLQIVILLVNCLFIDFQRDGFSGIISLFKNVITALIPALFIVDLEKLKHALLAFVLGGSINTTLNIINGTASLDTGVRYMSEETLLSLNSFGHASLVFFLCTIVLFYLSDRKKWKYILLFNAVLILFSLFITGSRQSFMSMLAFFVILQFFELRQFNFRKIFRVFSFFLFFALVVYFVITVFPNSPIVRRFMEENEGDQARLYFYIQAWSLFLQKPIIGYGVGTFGNFSSFVYTHSTYSELLFTGGLFYVLFYALYYVKFLLYGNRMIKKVYDPKIRKPYVLSIAFIVALLVNGLFFLVHESRIALSLQFLLVNFVFSSKRLKEKE